MQARDLMQAASVVGRDEPAAVLFRAFADPSVRAVAVVSTDGALVATVTEEDLLNRLLPSYVIDDETLARVVDQDVITELYARFEGKRVADLLPRPTREHPSVPPDATLVEVAAAMVRSGDPAVLVVDGGRVAGVVTIDVLLPALLRAAE